MRTYKPADERYDKMTYRYIGNSGLQLPALSLGLWHNFGGVDPYERGRDIVLKAFDSGITHFDLANNYGPPPGSAEENFGKMMKQDLHNHRDELVISSKAGFGMWPGPYGDWGSRKYLIASLDQSLQRMGLDYVDIFYHHRPDPNTPLEETMMALAQIVRQGKALYVGVSRYTPDMTRKAVNILREERVPFIIHQPMFSMFVRDPIESGLLDTLDELGLGCIAFSPLAKGMLTDKYLDGVPEDSRMASPHGELEKDELSEDRLRKIKELNEVAQERGQSLAQLALVWVLNQKAITSALIGVSRVEQLEDNLAALDNSELSGDEQKKIENILKG